MRHAGRNLVFVVVCAWAGLLGAAHGAGVTLAQLDAIQELSEKDNPKALQQLEALSASVDAATPYAVQRSYLNTLMNLQWDAADIAAVGKTVEKLLALANAANDDAGQVLAHCRAAGLLSRQGNNPAALVSLVALEPKALAANDPAVAWRYYLSLGTSQLSAAQFEAALGSALKSLEASWKLAQHSKAAQLRSLNLMGNVYSGLNNWTKSLAVSEEALLLAEEVGASKMLGSLHLNQGNTYSSLGRTAESVESFEQALAVGREHGLLGLQASALNNLGDSYLTSKSFAKAQASAGQALELYKQIGDLEGVAIATTNLGLAQMAIGKIKEGAALVNASLKYFHEAGDKSNEESILGELAKMYEQTAQYQDALDTVRRQQKLSKELFSTDREMAVATLQEQFDKVKRDKQIELLAQENNLKDAEISNRRFQQIVTVLAAVVTVLAGLFIFTLYRKARKANQELKEANAQLEFHSVRDPLTGLYNRRSFLDLMKRRTSTAARSRRDDGGTDGLMILDIDHFKNINDTLGHAGGDQVLVEIARRLSASVRDTDMVMRWGGEEFLIYSTKASTRDLQHLASRVLNIVGDTPVIVAGKNLNVTVTGGFLTLPFSGLSEDICGWEKAMQIADLALYLGKVNGRNRAYGLGRLLQPFEQAMPVLEHDISAAIKAKMVELLEVVGPARKPDSGPSAPLPLNP